MNGYMARLARGLLLSIAALLLQSAVALGAGSPSTESETYGIACAISGDCVATGPLSGGGEFALQYHAGSWAPTATDTDVAPAFCSPVACVLPPHSWGGTWQSEANDAFTNLPSPKLPSNATGDSYLTGVSASCTWPNDCTFAGTYTVKGGADDGVFLTEVNGKWRADAEPRWPPGDPTHRNVWLGDISCSRPGECTAAGYFEYNPTHFKAMLVTESGGAWGHDVVIDLPHPAQAPPTTTPTIACGAAPYCVAVGPFGVKLEKPTSKDIYGVWSSMKVTSDLHPDDVACSITDNCVIVGGDVDGGTILEQRKGVWKPMKTVLDAGKFTHVTCPGVGECVAISQSSIATETSGVWGAPFTPTPPGDADTTSADATIGSISCESVGNCFALGTYMNNTPALSQFIVTETGGVWNTAAATFPA